MSSSLPVASRLSLACALALQLAASPALAQTAETAPPPAPPPAPQAPATPPTPPTPPSEQEPEALLVAEPPPATKPLFALGNDTYFIKPILALAGGFHSENLLVNPTPDKESRLTTLAIARFGFEGRLGEYVTFRSEFERNIRAHGSGVWEGTASFSVRDQVLRLQRWGGSVEAGIILDPASVDYFSAHMGDVLLADKYTRDPLLYSGFNRGQGVQARYTLAGLTAGLSFSEANPLSTSASFMVGGTFGVNSRFWERPLGNFRTGQPDDDIHFRVISPSLSYEHEHFEAKAMVQVFRINAQASRRDDPTLRGYNVRGNARLKLQRLLSLPFEVTPFVNVARVENDVLNPTAGLTNTLLKTRFNALTLSGGLDVFLSGKSGVGVNYVRVVDQNPTYTPATSTTPENEPINTTTNSYLNVGGTWWLTDQVALGARVATWTRNIQGKPELDEQELSGFLTLRMLL